MPDEFDADLSLFRQQYLENAEAAAYHAKWAQTNPGEASKWVAFRGALLAGETSPVPALKSRYGRALVGAGQLHMSVSRLVAQVRRGPPPPPPPPPTGQEVFLSDLPYTVVANGWGPVEKDRSNGEDAAGDGNPLTLNGTVYPKGLGVHAPSDVRVALGGSYKSFTATIGVDDEVGASGSVVFEVWCDGVLKFQSATLTGASASVAVNVDVTNVQELRLVVTDAGNGNDFDHADWADTKLIAAVAPPPSGIVYPASYFTGPLGIRNPLPPRKGAFLGTWPGLPGGTITWDEWKAWVPAREALLGRKYDFLMIQDLDYLWPNQQMQWIADRGSIPCAAGMHFNPLTVTQIAAGQADATIDKYADFWGSKDFVMMVRLFHEFDMGHVPYTAIGRTADFIAAWRRIVERFKARGADNVGFWWCPTEGNDRATIIAAYPGDEYVDWVGSDNYNFCFVGEIGCYSQPMHDGWSEFWEIFDYTPGPGYQSQHSYWGPRKPFVIGETGTTYDPAYPAKKPDWYRAVPAALKNMNCTGISFFDQDVSLAEGPKNNWLVDRPTSDPAIFAGFVDMARDPYLNTR